MNVQTRPNQTATLAAIRGSTLRAAVSILVIAVIAVIGGCGVHTVGTGHRGIKTTFGKVIGPPLAEGLYFVNPLTTAITPMDVRVLKWEDKTEAYTKDVQEAQISFVLNYRLQPDYAADVFQNIGPDWSQKLVGQVVYQRLKDTIGAWDAVDLVANRQKVTDSAQAQIAKDLASRHVDVTGYTITDIEFSRAFNAAVEAKVIAQQQAQQAQNRTEQIKQEAEQKVIAAKAEAESMKIRADALSQNAKLVQWEAVQKWDGKLPVNMYGGSAVPFVDVSGK